MQENFDQMARKFDHKQSRHDRAQAVAMQLRHHVSLTPSMHVLEFGCGTGLLGFHLVPQVAFLTFADTSAGMLAQVDAKIYRQQVRNAATLPLIDDQSTLPQRYNGIVTLLTLHHIPAYERTVEVLANHLSANGWLAIADIDTEDGSFHDAGIEVPHTGIDRQQLRHIFCRIGLTQIQESTPYIVKRCRENIWKEFPVFLMTGRKCGEMNGFC